MPAKKRKDREGNGEGICLCVRARACACARVRCVRCVRCVKERKREEELLMPGNNTIGLPQSKSLTLCLSTESRTNCWREISQKAGILGNYPPARLRPPNYVGHLSFRKRRQGQRRHASGSRTFKMEQVTRTHHV
jgi:hypothetical protein